MRKDVLDKANELEYRMGYYDKIALICSFPYMRFKLFRGKAYISNSDETTNILIRDEELAKLIEKYCNEKKAKLQAELDEL